MNKFIPVIAAFCCAAAVRADAYAAVYPERFTYQDQILWNGEAVEEEIVSGLPEAVISINKAAPLVRAYLKGSGEECVKVRAEQYSRSGRLLRTDEFENITVTSDGTSLGFVRARNAEMVKLYADDTYIGGINDDETLRCRNGINFSAAPSDHQIYQRNAGNTASVSFAGRISPENKAEGGVLPDENITLEDGSVVVKFSEDSQPAVIFAAGYDNDHNLQSVSIINKPENENSVTVDTNGECSSEKIMICESISSMKPIYKTLSLVYTNSISIEAVNRETSEKTIKTVRADPVTLEFAADITLCPGLYDISVICRGQKTAFEDVGVGDIWVAAGQSNMTDMGAVTDGFDPDTDDPVGDNMHIMFAENARWQKMTHPAGEGRFFKDGVRTSPVTSFARIIAEDQGIPVGIVQSSVGGTYMCQWAKGTKPSGSTDGYLMDALKSCFDEMPSADIKGILWYQGCSDTVSERYAYDYENLQRTLFSQMRGFFGEDTPIITTQLNDASLPDEKSCGYYDAWSFVKDVQRRNPELYENVYVVGTNALDLGDTIHNSAASNLILGGEWAAAALNRVYGRTDIPYLHPTADAVNIIDEHTINVVFRDTQGLYIREDKKRLDITGEPAEIQLGDLKQEFAVRMGGGRMITSSNANKGTPAAITGAELLEDGRTVVLTVAEELAGVVAVDCCCGRYFAPSLTDRQTGWSVLSFFNVIADWGDGAAADTSVTYKAADTALLSEEEIKYGDFPHTLSEDIAAGKARYMYLNKNGGMNAYPLIKFDLKGLDTSRVQSAKLRIYTNEISENRTGNISVHTAGTDWNALSEYKPSGGEFVKVYADTSQIFPENAYSDIDITEYISSLENPGVAAFLISADYAAGALMCGADSEHPPEIVVQSGRIVKISCKDTLGMPAAGLTVTIAGVHSTEYGARTFVADENGEIAAVLADGEYKAVIPEGRYSASENRFAVSGDSSLEYTLEISGGGIPEESGMPDVPPAGNMKIIPHGDTSAKGFISGENKKQKNPFA